MLSSRLPYWEAELPEPRTLSELNDGCIKTTCSLLFAYFEHVKRRPEYDIVHMGPNISGDFVISEVTKLRIHSVSSILLSAGGRLVANTLSDANSSMPMYSVPLPRSLYLHGQDE